jgi:hypothetical protein
MTNFDLDLSFLHGVCHLTPQKFPLFGVVGEIPGPRSLSLRRVLAGIVMSHFYCLLVFAPYVDFGLVTCKAPTR